MRQFIARFGAEGQVDRIYDRDSSSYSFGCHDQQPPSGIGSQESSSKSIMRATPTSAIGFSDAYGHLR
jgi:hypothetical protein